MDKLNLLLSNLATPALIIAVVAYLTNFFGKIIEDQNSFADDKSWSIELRGVLFLIDISTGILGVYLALLFPWKNYQFLNFVSFFAIGLVILALQSCLTTRKEN